jgi:hypothetical protein
MAESDKWFVKLAFFCLPSIVVLLYYRYITVSDNLHNFMSFRLFLVMAGSIGTAAISICHLSLSACGPGSEVGIATGYGLDGPGGGEIFRTYPDRSWGPPSLLYNGYRLFPGGKEWPGRNAGPSPPSSAIGCERIELYLYSPYGPYGLYRASVSVQ